MVHHVLNNDIARAGCTSIAAPAERLELKNLGARFNSGIQLLGLKLG